MRGNNAVAAPDQDAGELDQLERLVDIQRQIVELAEQNTAMERDCLALRAAMVEEFERRKPRTGAVWKKLLRLLGRQPNRKS